MSFNNILLKVLGLFFLVENISSRQHKCIHNLIQKEVKVGSIDVDYGDNHQRRLAASNYQSIRILPVWKLDELDAVTKKHAMEMASAAIRYFESYIKVIRATKPIRFVKPGTWFESCGQDVKFSQFEKSAGYSETDLVIYVTSYGARCKRSAGGGTLAYALHCLRDQYKRPVAGHINLCPMMLENIDWRGDIVTILHELTHVLAMSAYLWRDMPNITPRTIQKGQYSHEYITSPKVAKAVQEHFNCHSIQGAALEDSGGPGTAGSHWDEHFFLTEYMCGMSNPSSNYLSKITLALFEDTGFYQIDYDYAAPGWTWGKNLGCNFFNTACLKRTSTGTKSNFKGYFCDGNNVGCTYDYISKGSCGLFNYGSTVKHRYFESATMGGSQYSSFCPWVSGTSTRSSPFCTDVKGNTERRKYSFIYDFEKFGSSSRCVSYNVYNQGKIHGVCLVHKCISSNSIEISVTAGDSITCSTAEEGTWKTTSKSQKKLLCPKIASICIGTKPFECQFGFYSPSKGKCICDTGYTGQHCETEDRGIMKCSPTGPCERKPISPTFPQPTKKPIPTPKPTPATSTGCEKIVEISGTETNLEYFSTTKNPLTKVVCFKVSSRFTCNNPTLKVSFAGLDYYSPSGGKYFEYAYQNENNLLVRSLASSQAINQCNTWFSDGKAHSLNDGPWSSSSGVKKIFLKNGPNVASSSVCGGKYMNARATIRCLDNQPAQKPQGFLDATDCMNGYYYSLQSNYPSTTISVSSQTPNSKVAACFVVQQNYKCTLATGKITFAIIDYSSTGKSLSIQYQNEQETKNWQNNWNCGAQCRSYCQTNGGTMDISFSNLRGYNKIYFNVGDVKACYGKTISAKVQISCSRIAPLGQFNNVGDVKFDNERASEQWAIYVIIIVVSLLVIGIVLFLICKNVNKCKSDKQNSEQLLKTDQDQYNQL